MHNNLRCDISEHMVRNNVYHNPNPQNLPGPVPCNKFIYVKQQCINFNQSNSVSTKVFMNPHFKNSKVYVNPNFNNTASASATIYINPRLQSSSLNMGAQKNAVIKSSIIMNTKVHINPNFQKIHVNPKVLQNITTSTCSNTMNYCDSVSSSKHVIKPEVHNKISFSSATKLVREPTKTSGIENKRKRRTSVRTKYRIIKSSSNTSLENMPKNVNRFKVDNRISKDKIKKKFIYVNKLFSISDIAKNVLIKKNGKLKNSSYVDINGVVFKKSPNSLKRSMSFTSENYKGVLGKTITKSKYKLVRKSAKIVDDKKLNGNQKLRRNSTVKRFKIVRTSKFKKKTKASPKKLKKCNIPCPYYRKFGMCKGKEKGICNRKHDPDQIALCTKFLQGACINEKCLLSHKVSAEKMPTCKYFLEGSCSRENCPYLHVKINPKADICRDFLEGYCKKAAECNKRHQLLCPEYEKYGKCLKQRCQYPHGNMVRKYLVNKEKFAKKCSVNKEIIDKGRKNIINKRLVGDEQTENLVLERARYYIDNLPENNDRNEKNIFKDILGIRSRPKLGELPSFIPFDGT